MSMQFYIGIVEDRFDPIKLGRYRVRVFGVHTESLVDIPTYSLPWATPLSINASMSGIGFASNYVEGSLVYVFFQDEESKQMPVIMGSVAGVPVNKFTFPGGTVMNESTVAIGTYEESVPPSDPGTDSGNPIVIPPVDPPDPDTLQFSFAEKTAVALGEMIYSEMIVLSGISTEANISISGPGEFSINSGNYQTAAAKVVNSNTVKVRQLSSSAENTAVVSTLTIGTVSAAFKATTLTTSYVAGPDQFNISWLQNLTPPFNIAPRTELFSDWVIITGIPENSTVPVSVTSNNCLISYFVHHDGVGDDYTTLPGTIALRERLMLKVIASRGYDIEGTATLTIGSKSQTFSIKTIENPAAPVYTLTCPTYLAFGAYAVGFGSSIAPKTINISSPNGATISSASIDNTSFIITGKDGFEYGSPISTAGAQLYVKYMPTDLGTNGNHNGRLTITSNASSSPNIVHLSGNAVAPVVEPPADFIMIDTINFGQSVHNPNQAPTAIIDETTALNFFLVTLYNPGSTAVHIDAPTITPSIDSPSGDCFFVAKKEGTSNVNTIGSFIIQPKRSSNIYVAAIVGTQAVIGTEITGVLTFGSHNVDSSHINAPKVINLSCVPAVTKTWPLSRLPSQDFVQISNTVTDGNITGTRVAYINLANTFNIPFSTDEHFVISNISHNNNSLVTSIVKSIYINGQYVDMNPQNALLSIYARVPAPNIKLTYKPSGIGSEYVILTYISTHPNGTSPHHIVVGIVTQQ